MPLPPRILLALLCPLVFLACAKEEHHDASNTFPVYQYEEEGLTLLSVLKRAPLTFSAGALPKSAESVGMMAMAASPINPIAFSIGQCTGWLIERNVVATNSHCITEEIAKASDCGPTLAIKFPKPDAKGVDTYSCKKLLRRSDISGDALIQPDWAFFEISADEREPLRVSRHGVADETPLRSLRVDPTGGGGLGGDFSEAYCKAVQNSVLNYGFKQNYSPTALAFGCPVKHGNSGSPIFNANTGEVVGIAQAFLTTEFMAGANEELKGFGLKYPPSPPPHIIFTNLSCVPDARTGYPNNLSTCSENKAAPNEAKEKEISAFLMKELSRESDAWEKGLPSFAVYKFELKSDPIVARANPICLRPLLQWPADILDTRITNGYVFRSLSYRARYEAELELKPVMKLDSELRLSPELDMKATKNERLIQLSFSREGGAIEVSDRSIGIAPILNQLHWCSAEELARGNIPPTLSQMAD